MIDPKTMAQRLRCFGYTGEDLRTIVAPMAVNGQEPIGSMGVDTPLAVLSRRPKLLFNYFKQLFAQVTNPPIDPLREGLVMSLMSFVGKQQNPLDETPEHCRQLKLSHPILTNEDMERLRSAARDDLKIVTLPSLFPANDFHPAWALAQALDELVDAAERAIAAGAYALDPERPGRHAEIGADSQPAGHFGVTPRSVVAAVAESGGHRRRKRRAARGHALLHVVRLRRQRRQSVSGLRGRAKTPR